MDAKVIYNENTGKFEPIGPDPLVARNPVVQETATQTLSNKTLTAPVISNAAFTNLIEDIITTKALTAAESGKFIFLDLANGFVTTLPAVAAGLEYTFIVKLAPTGGAYTIVCPAAATLFKGHVLSNDLNAVTDADFDTTAVATITLVQNKSVAGDRVHVVCDGTNWFYSAECSVFDAITGT